MSKHRKPLAYFITIRTYGTMLHGSTSTTVSRRRNRINTPYISKSNNLASQARARMSQKSVVFDPVQRSVVLNGILYGANELSWKIYAIHVRTNHVHIVCSSSESPELMMRRIKSFASKELNKIFRQKYWVRHGSTKYIFDERYLVAAIKYTINQQGRKMAYWCLESYKHVL